MDIKDLYTADKHNEGSEMRVRDQYGEDLDMFIRIAGVDSDAYRECMRAQRLRMITDTAEVRKKTDYDLDLLVESTIDWRGFMDKDKELEFSKQRIKELYQCAPYIRDQVQAFIEERINFIQG